MLFHDNNTSLNKKYPGYSKAKHKLLGQCKGDFLKNKIAGLKKTAVTTEAMYLVAYTTAYISVNS